MRVGVLFVVAALVGCAGSVCWAKDIQELPRDLATWSTAWIEVPKGMAEETQENGPLMGVIVGPWEGMAAMAGTVAEAGARGIDQKRTITPTVSRTAFGRYVNGERLSRRYDTSGLPKGPILRYDF